MIIKKSVFLLIVFFISFDIFSQNTQPLQSGFIVKASGDTIKGYINRLKESDLSKGILFSETPNPQNALQFKPLDIKAFAFDADHVSFEVVEYTYKRDSIKLTESRFGKIISKGYVDLYKLQLPDDENKEIFEDDNTAVYIVKKEGNYYVLDQKEKILDRTDNFNYVLDKRYIGMLTFIVNDCPKVKAEIDRSLAFTDKAISGVVKRYNNCMQPDVAPKEFTYSVKPKIRKGIQLGYATLWKTPTSKEVGFSGGVFFDILKPDINNNISILLGARYLNLRYKLGKEDIKDHLLLVPVTVNVFLSQKKFAPFVNIGCTASINKTDKLDAFFFSYGIGAYIGKIRVTGVLDSEDVLGGGKIVNVLLGYSF